MHSRARRAFDIRNSSFTVDARDDKFEMIRLVMLLIVSFILFARQLNCCCYFRVVLNRRWRQFLIHRLLPHLPPPIITTTIDQVTVDTEVDTTVVVAAITEGMPTDIATATIITFGTEITSTSSTTIINFLILLDDRHSLSVFQCI